MRITDVKIYPYSGKGSLVAFANVTFDRCFVVRGFRIFDGKKGLFMACPSEQISKDDYRDTAFPITAEFRETLNDAIVEAYEDYDEDDEPPKKSSKKSSRKSSGKRTRDVDEDELPD